MILCILPGGGPLCHLGQRSGQCRPPGHRKGPPGIRLQGKTKQMLKPQGLKDFFIHCLSRMQYFLHIQIKNK
jgi:hypothetical protein